MSNQNEIRDPMNGWLDQRDELLTAYLDEELSGEERALVEQRLSEDVEFRSRLVELERAWEALDDLPRAVPNHSFTKSTVELAVAELTQELRGSQAWYSIWLPRLAAFLLLPVLMLGVAYAVTYSIRMQPYRQLVRDLELIENFEMYDKINCDIRFLEMLESQGLFAGAENNGPS